MSEINSTLSTTQNIVKNAFVHRRLGDKNYFYFMVEYKGCWDANVERVLPRPFRKGQLLYRDAIT